jgi:biofilm PGA synthesis protein PgaD
MVKELGDVIINARNVLSRRIRTRDRMLTTAMWLLYAYLWLPLVSLGAWYLGVQFAYDLVIRAGGPESLVSLLISFLLILFGTAVVVILWSRLQRARFAGHERRVSSPKLESADEQAYWSLEDADFQRLRSGKRLVIDLDENGRMTSVKE